MHTININQLAKQMRSRKEQGEKPYLLFLGAGISISSGVSGMNELINRFLIDSGIVSDENVEEMDREQRFEKFVAAMENLSEIDRYNWLRAGFENRKPSIGYDALTRLIEEGYFDVILTTNWDGFLNESLEKSHKLKSQKDFRSYVRGVDDDDFIILSFRRFSVPRIKILKLHGELTTRVMFVTPDETDKFPKEFMEFLKGLFKNYDLMMIGYSVSDMDVKKCLDPKQNALIYVNPNPPSDPSFLAVTSRFKYAQQVVGQDAEFDVFMSKLSETVFRDDLRTQDEESFSLLEKISMDVKRLRENSDWLVDYLRNQQRT